jgi:serine/threonine protein phosphatase PrpC
MTHSHTLSLDLGQHWHQGSRREQQDYFATTDLEDLYTHRGFLAVVADGMGGHASGAEASSIAIHQFVNSYQTKSPEESIPTALRRALDEANNAVFVQNEQQESNMGTTLVATVVQENRLYWISVGDSSLFWYSDGELQEINEKHSYGNELDTKVKQHLLLPEEAQTEFPKRHQLTSYLGLEQIPAVDLAAHYRELKAGEKLLLCSDGLVNALSLVEITASLAPPQSGAQNICEELIEKALTKGYSNQDNITVILLALQEHRFQEPSDTPATTWGFSSLAIIISSMVLIGVTIGVIIYLFSGDLDQVDTGPPLPAANSSSPLLPVSSPPPPPKDIIQPSSKLNPADLEKWNDCKAVDSTLALQKVQTLLWQQENREELVEPSYKKYVEGKWMDGKTGPYTELAIHRYQTNKGLTNTGFLNRETCKQLAVDNPKTAGGK